MLVSLALLPACGFAQDATSATEAAEKAAPVNDPEVTYEMLNLFGDVFERVRENYVEPVDDRELLEAAINGMLTSLDPHSSFLDKRNFKEMRVQTKGEFGGLGIEVTMENGLVKVVSPIDDTPAAKAGVQAGDYITHIDGEAVMGLTLSDAVEKMRGKVGTDILLTIARESASEPLELTLTRDVIRINSVKHDRREAIGYIRITSFSEQTFDKMQAALKELKAESEGLDGLVLDLRNNPGGLLDQAIAVSDAFLEQGEIVSTRGRNKDDSRRYSAKAGDMLDGKPVVVLINQGSASASEIVAGALQDHERGIIIGTKSFGKGSVQTVIPLGSSGDVAMRLTTQRYYTPSGTSIQAEGITPDIIVKQAEITPLQRSAYARSEADLRGRLDNDNGKKPIKGAPNSVRTGGDDDSDAEPVDYQLERAFGLVRGLTIYHSNQTQHSAK